MSLTNVCQKLKAPRSEGESRRIGEDHSANLPRVTNNYANDLQGKRENGENSLQSYTCAGARAPGAQRRVRETPLSPLFSPHRSLPKTKARRVIGPTEDPAPRPRTQSNEPQQQPEADRKVDQ